MSESQTTCQCGKAGCIICKPDLSPSTTGYYQIEYMLMELMQKNFYLREARTMMEVATGRMGSDLRALIRKMVVERDALKRRIDDAQYPED